ncbi:hypothetical protein B0H13DRAFT_2029083 [Mycena leptocephala]|nr:hypothetical protein B0H13DRAFT_2029083 [Mycena leptocephala]
MAKVADAHPANMSAKQTQSHAFRIVLCILSLSAVARTSSTESDSTAAQNTRRPLPPLALGRQDRNEPHLRLSPQDRAQCKSNSRMVLSSRAWVSRCWSVILDRRQRRRTNLSQSRNTQPDADVRPLRSWSSSTNRADQAAIDSCMRNAGGRGPMSVCATRVS